MERISTMPIPTAVTNPTSPKMGIPKNKGGVLASSNSADPIKMAEVMTEIERRFADFSIVSSILRETPTDVLVYVP